MIITWRTVEFFRSFYWYKIFVTNLFTHVSIRPLAELFHLHNSQRELAYKLRGWFRPRSNREVWLFLPNLVRLPFWHGNLPLGQNHPGCGKPGQSLKWHPPTRSSTRDHTDIRFFCRYRPLLSIPSHRQGSTKIDMNYQLGTFHHYLSQHICNIDGAYVRVLQLFTNKFLISKNYGFSSKTPFQALWR